MLSIPVRGFKRFGGEFSGDGDPGDFRIATIGVVLMFGFCLAAIAKNDSELAIIGFFLLLVFSFFSTFFSGGLAIRYLAKIKARRLLAAGMQFEAGNFRGCVKTLEKLRVWGALPSDYEEMYDQAIKESERI